jgi:hypothetical protein
VLEVGQAGGARARAGQRIGLGDRQLMQERVAVCMGLRPVTRGLPAIAGRLVAVARRAGTGLDGCDAVGLGTLPVLRCARHDLRALRGALVVGHGGFARHEVAIAQSGDLIARQRPHVASVRHRVASGSRMEPALGAIGALLRAAIANVAGDVVRAWGRRRDRGLDRSPPDRCRPRRASRWLSHESHPRRAQPN